MVSETKVNRRVNRAKPPRLEAMHGSAGLELAGLGLPTHRSQPQILNPPSMSDVLFRFEDFVHAHGEICDQLQRVQSPDEILALAAAYGFEVSKQELIAYAVSLTAECWVWSGKPSQWRRYFLHEGRRPEAD